MGRFLLDVGAKLGWNSDYLVLRIGFADVWAARLLKSELGCDLWPKWCACSLAVLNFPLVFVDVQCDSNLPNLAWAKKRTDHLLRWGFGTAVDKHSSVLVPLS